ADREARNPHTRRKSGRCAWRSITSPSKSKSATSARAAVISFACTRRRMTCATSTSIKCGACRRSAGCRARAAMRSARGVCSTSSTAAEASSTINGRRAPRAAPVSATASRDRAPAASSAQPSPQVSAARQSCGPRGSGSPTGRVPPLPPVPSVAGAALPGHFAAESSLPCSPAYSHVQHMSRSIWSASLCQASFRAICSETSHGLWRPIVVRCGCHRPLGRKIMNAERRSYVLNLPEWELPRLDDLEFALVEELAARTRAKRINSESLEDVFSKLLHNRLLTLVESAVNEVIEYWLKGLGDGNDGHWPELRVELPYLEHREI